MIKKLISLTVASATTLALAGCGATDTGSVDNSLMGDGSGNQTGLKGYWWTYVDRGATSSVVPNTGKKEPQSATAKELNAKLDLNNGIEMDPETSGNRAFHIKGVVGPQPDYPPPVEIYDAYWDEIYSKLCLDSKCKEYKYPSSGMGFGFHVSNKPLGTDATGKVGLSFRMKVGGTHAKSGDGTTPRPIAISLPMDYTDVPDPSFDDAFGTASLGLTKELYPDAAETENLPLCSFPGTKKKSADGTVTEVGPTSKTCFANLTTGAAKFKALDIKETWQTFCVKWDDFAAPSWAGGLTNITYVDGGITKVDPAHIIKMQFDAYKPTAADGADYAAAFDFWVDDVYLLDQAKWDVKCKDAQLVQTL